MSGQAKILSQDEIKSVFKFLKNDRDRALFALGIYSGLRIGEIITLERKQLFTKDDGVRNLLKVIRLKRKNTVYSEIPIHPKLRDRLLAYQKSFKEKPRSKWLFPSDDSAAGHLGTGIAKLSPGATRNRKAFQGERFRIGLILNDLCNAVESSHTGNFLIA